MQRFVVEERNVIKTNDIKTDESSKLKTMIYIYINEIAHVYYNSVISTQLYDKTDS